MVLAAAAVLMVGTPANAAIVATVSLGTSTNYAVLGASTVTNTGDSTLAGSLGLWPGTSITGFPPGLVLAPGTTDTTNAAAQQAQSALTAAYVDAEGRPLTANTPADLANLTLQAGVYAGPDKSPLSLTGPLTLDGGGDRRSVFIFQTSSTLITGSSSTVGLINGAQECNVFWQVGSSATLGSSSTFAGNILALTSITVNNGVTVRGRALARNGAVTLDDDTFTRPTCALVPPSTTTTGGSGTTTTTTPGGTATTTPGSDTTTSPGGDATTNPGSDTTTTPGGDTTTTPGGDATTPAGTMMTPGGTTTTPGSDATTTPGGDATNTSGGDATTAAGGVTTTETGGGGTPTELARTGFGALQLLGIGAWALAAGGLAIVDARRRTVAPR